MLFEEWKGLMHLSVDDNGKSADIAKRRSDLSGIFGQAIADNEPEYKALFALQTTYAVIVKLIACKVLDNINFSDDARGYHDLVGLTSDKLQHLLQMMEDGYSYRNRDVRNFLEGDFFSWYSDVNQWSESFFSDIRELIYIVDDYSAFSFNVQYNPVDIFKDLYMGIIPQSIRHSMGEYFTPEWLADCVVTRALEMLPQGREWKAIDPCCGSGIFIVSLIKKVVGDRAVADMTKEERQKLVGSILRRVHGIDINPLSVLSARVSYFLALHRLGDVSDVEIPVYLGDSAIIPVSKTIDGIPCYAYSVNNLKCESFDIVLPKRFVRRSDFGEQAPGAREGGMPGSAVQRVPREPFRTGKEIRGTSGWHFEIVGKPRGASSEAMGRDMDSHRHELHDDSKARVLRSDSGQSAVGEVGTSARCLHEKDKGVLRRQAHILQRRRSVRRGAAEHLRPNSKRHGLQLAGRGRRFGVSYAGQHHVAEFIRRIPKLLHRLRKGQEALPSGD